MKCDKQALKIYVSHLLAQKMHESFRGMLQMNDVGLS